MKKGKPDLNSRYPQFRLAAGSLGVLLFCAEAMAGGGIGGSGAPITQTADTGILVAGGNTPTGGIGGSGAPVMQAGSMTDGGDTGGGIGGTGHRPVLDGNAYLLPYGSTRSLAIATAIANKLDERSVQYLLPASPLVSYHAGADDALSHGMPGPADASAQELASGMLSRNDLCFASYGIYCDLVGRWASTVSGAAGSRQIFVTSMGSLAFAANTASPAAITTTGNGAHSFADGANSGYVTVASVDVNTNSTRGDASNTAGSAVNISGVTGAGKSSSAAGNTASVADTANLGGGNLEVSGFQGKTTALTDASLSVAGASSASAADGLSGLNLVSGSINTSQAANQVSIAGVGSAGLTVSTAPSAPQVARWLASPTSNDWQNPANWAAGVLPGTGVTVELGASSVSRIDSISGTIGTLRFTPGAPAYTLYGMPLGGLPRPGFVASGLEITNSIDNQSNNNQLISVYSGYLGFSGGASAGDSVTLQTTGFSDTSQCNSERVCLGVPQDLPHGTGLIKFSDHSTADHATVINLSSQVGFYDTSTADFADIHNQDGSITFNNNSSAGHANIVSSGVGVRTGMSYFPSAFTRFMDSASAGSATIINNRWGATIFAGVSIAENSQITNNSGGVTVFGDASSAANAKIVNNDRGRTYFYDNSTAGRATIVNNSGGSTSFYGGVTAKDASVINNAGGTVDVIGASTLQSNSTIDEVTIGAISGAGNISLINASLSVGSLNTDMLLSGSISKPDFYCRLDMCWGTDSYTASLNKVGSGALVLSGNSTYTGDTNVNAGMLVVTGSLASSVIVNDGAIFGGSGTVVGLSANSGAIVAPGRAGTTLNVSGNVAFNAGSVYQVSTNAAGQSSSIRAAGSANINNGSMVSVVAGSGDYHPSTDYTILTASGGVNGTFGGAVSNSAFLIPTLRYDQDNVFLNLQRNGTGFIDVGDTPNQDAVADILDKIAGTPTPTAPKTEPVPTTETGPVGTTGSPTTTAGTGTSQPNVAATPSTMTGLTDDLLMLSAPDAQRALTTLSGQTSANLPRIQLGNMRMLNQQLLSRMAGYGSGFGLQSSLPFSNVQLAYEQPVSDAPPPYVGLVNGNSPDGRGFWLQGIGSRGGADSSGGALGYDYSTGGLAAGIDRAITDRFTLGFNAAYTRNNVDFDTVADNSHIDSGYLNIYAAYADGPWQAKGVLGYGHSRYHSKRYIEVGSDTSIARGDTSGNEFGAYGEIAYDIPLNSLTIQPVAGLNLGWLKRDGYSESGAGAADLKVDDDILRSASTNLGLRIKRDFGESASGRTHLEARVLWSHEFGNTDATTTSSFVNAPGATFKVDGVQVRRDGFILGGGIAHEVSRKLSLYADYNAELRGDGQDQQTLVGGIRFEW